MNRIVWINEIEKIQILLNKGKTLEDIGKIYGVTKQRLYQVLTKFGLNTPLRNKKNFLKDKEPKYYWLNRLLCSKGVLKKDRMEILKTLSLPINCPILKMTRAA